MSTHDIYFNRAIDHAYEMLRDFDGVKPSFEKILNHPARDDIILSGLETPVFRSVGTESTLITIRVWIQSIHSEAWSKRIEQTLQRRLNYQSGADMIRFEVRVITYYT